MHHATHKKLVSLFPVLIEFPDFENKCLHINFKKMKFDIRIFLGLRAPRQSITSIMDYSIRTTSQ